MPAILNAPQNFLALLAAQGENHVANFLHQWGWQKTVKGWWVHPAHQGLKHAAEAVQIAKQAQAKMLAKFNAA